MLDRDFVSVKGIEVRIEQDLELHTAGGCRSRLKIKRCVEGPARGNGSGVSEREANHIRPKTGISRQSGAIRRHSAAKVPVPVEAIADAPIPHTGGLEIAEAIAAAEQAVTETSGRARHF